MKQNLNNVRLEACKKEKTYNSKILIFLFICIVIAFLFMAVLKARANSIEQFKRLQLQNFKYTKQINMLLIEKKSLMKRLVEAKKIELSNLLEKSIYFEAVKLKSRSYRSRIMKKGLKKKR